MCCGCRSGARRERRLRRRVRGRRRRARVDRAIADGAGAVGAGDRGDVGAAVTLSGSHWRCDRGLYGPAKAPNAMLDRDRLETVFLAPLRYCLALAMQLINNIPASVIRLNELCGPSAIAGFVVPVIVDAIEAKSIRTDAHVGEKILESTPLLIDGDASPAVPVVLLVSRTRTPINHRSPRVVGRRARHQMRAVAFAHETTAGSSVTAAKLVAVHELACTARALAIPQNSVARNDGKFAKYAAGQIDEGWHRREFTRHGLIV